MFEVVRAALTALLMCTMCAPHGQAQTFPSKPIRFVLGFPPGGSNDLIARLISPRLSNSLGQQVIVDNRPGADGLIARDMVAKSTPDGYTITLTSLTALVLSPLLRNLPYDPLKEFAPIARLAQVQNILIAHPTVPARTLKEFIALAKARPGKLNYASSGDGGTGHFAGELLKSMTGIDIVHIPYKGGGLAINDLLAGHVETFMAVISTAVPHVQAGKAKAYGVTGGKRTAALPDVPTIAEAGVPGYEATNWYGIVAPAHTAQPVVRRLNAEIVAAMNDGEVRQFLGSRGVDVFTSTPEEFSAYLKSEAVKWTAILRSLAVKPIL